MRKLLGLVFILLGFWVLIGTLTDSAVGRWFTRGYTATETASLEGVGRIEVRAPGSELRIIAEDRENVAAALHGGRRGELSVRRSGDTVSIRVGEGWFPWFLFRDDYRLEVRIPRDYDQSLAVEVDAGSVTLHGPTQSRPMMLNELALDVDAGDIELSHLRVERIRHRSGSGNVDARRVVANEAEWRLTSGDFRLEHVSGTLRVEMTSGNAQIRMDELSGPVEAELTSGELRLDLPRDAGFTLDARVTSGDIHIDFPLQVEETETGRTVTGFHGSGEHLVRLRTTSGNIRIE